jgi:hypothetical protein
MSGPEGETQQETYDEWCKSEDRKRKKQFNDFIAKRFKQDLEGR